MELHPYPQFWELSFWALPTCQIPSLSIFTLRPAQFLVPAPVCLELEGFMLERAGERPWQEEEEAAGQGQDASCSCTLGPVQAEPVPQGPGRPQRCHLLGARVSAQPGAPSWSAYKASSKFSPWSKPGRFTGPQVLWPGCQSPEGNGVSSLPASSLSAPRSKRTPLGGRGFLPTVFFHSLVSLSPS